jgi:hypothetical protein
VKQEAVQSPPDVLEIEMQHAADFIADRARDFLTRRSDLTRETVWSEPDVEAELDEVVKAYGIPDERKDSVWEAAKKRLDAGVN